MKMLFLQFIIYSFSGFLLEVLFARITHSVKQDRKCMFFLPLCPVYGFGALLIACLPSVIQENWVLLFLCGALAATATEYVSDWFCEVFLHVRFWNYASLPWNLNGRVCLLFSFFWGILSFPLVKWLHPLVLRWAIAIPTSFVLPIAVLVALDAVLTVYVLRASGTTDALRWYDRFSSPLRKES